MSTGRVETQGRIVGAEERMDAAAAALENVGYQHADFDEALATVADGEEVALEATEPAGRLQQRAHRHFKPRCLISCPRMIESGQITFYWRLHIFKTRVADEIDEFDFLYTPILFDRQKI